MQRKMTPDEVAWALDQTQKTPNFVAGLLAADGSFADYTDEAKDRRQDTSAQRS